MAEFELHADFDRDGRLTATIGEYRMRGTVPGAIILPNLDRDDVPLSTSVEPQTRIFADWQMTIRSRRDNDLLPIAIIPTGQPIARQGNYFLSIAGWNAGRVQILDEHHRQIIALPDMPNFFPLPAVGGRINLSVESATLAGSPLSSPTVVAGGGSSATLLNGDERELALEILHIDTNNQIRTVDQVILTLTPFIIPDDLQPVERVYICDDDPRNTPTVLEVEAVFRRLQVPLVKIPVSLHHGDVWIQDQIQFGFCESPSGWSRMVFHLPRIRHSDGRFDKENLIDFVTTSNQFPSRNVGTYNEFWQREFPVVDFRGVTHLLKFVDTSEIVNATNEANRLNDDLKEAISILDSSIDIPKDPYTFIEKYSQIPELFRLFDQAKNNWLAGYPLSTQRQRIERAQNSLQQRYQVVRNVIRIQGDRVSLRLGQDQVVMLNNDQANDMLALLWQMNDSLNYGGNIEGTPPIPQAPFGKLIIGNAPPDQRRKIDPDVLRFFRRQGVQPVVEVDTTWLSVGHVDEMLAVIPFRTGVHGFAFCLASPNLALEILEESKEQFLRGIPGDRSSYEPSGTNRRMTSAGPSPLTRLFRGYRWGKEIPRIYSRLAAHYRTVMRSSSDFPLPFRSDSHQTYPADINVFEVLAVATVVNELIEQKQMTQVREILSEQFPNIKQIALPVLYDTTGNFPINFDRRPVSAFLPGMVNLVVIGNHLIIPRQFGPRMGVQDAITVLSTVLQNNGYGRLVRRLTPRFFASRHLNHPILWTTHPYNPDGMDGNTDAFNIAEDFQDCFHGVRGEERVNRILRLPQNRGEFNSNGNLRSGWRKVTLPEETVDLFEAYAQIILEDAGLTVHWVDTWFYHARLGEIHCGTNVLRRLDLRGRPRWWRVAGAAHGDMLY